ncbi:hypothetical protein [Roseovarius confluentis]|uniref:hypothetical protein n=1 Tax=Roseovarius confluentis TaxID=1852027 RepID=UPI003BABD1B6
MKTYTVTKECFIFGTHYGAGDKTRPMTEDQAQPFLRGGQLEPSPKPKPKAKSED